MPLGRYPCRSLGVQDFLYVPPVLRIRFAHMRLRAPKILTPPWLFRGFLLKGISAFKITELCYRNWRCVRDQCYASYDI